MKASFISAILVSLPFFAQVLALSVPEPLAVRAFGRGGSGRGGSNGGNLGGKPGAGTGGTKGNSTKSIDTSTSSSTAPVNTSTSSAADTSTSTSTAAAATATASSSAGNTGNPQTSLTLDPAVLATGFENNGQGVPTAGQVASLTSSNNFINFCLTTNLPLTNGKQITTGSCNPAPMGIIAASTNMPSAKFTNPQNGDTLPANAAFTVTMAVANFQTGAFVNAQQNYFAAPQQVNSAGQIIGHSHVVIESVQVGQTTPTNPATFAFFKGLNAPASNGILSVDVTAGLPAGFYKISSINTAANHQPCLVAVAQHGSLDDAVYFTVSGNGAASSNATAAASNSAASNATVTTSSSIPAATSSAAPSATPASPPAGAGAKKGKFGGRSLIRRS